MNERLRDDLENDVEIMWNKRLQRIQGTTLGFLDGIKGKDAKYRALCLPV
jgi:hypothetical protein